MHGLDKTLLYGRQFDVSLVTAFTFHTGRDTTDDDDGIHVLHLVGKFSELDEFALADVTTQHGKVTITMLVFNHDIVGLASLHRERLVVGTATTEAEAKATTTAALRFFHDVAVDLEHITIISAERVLHITCEGSLVLTRKTDRQRILADTLSKAPCAEGGEVQFVVIVGHGRLATQTVVVEEFSHDALAVVEFLQVVDGRVAVRQFASLLVEHLRVRQSILDALKQ